MSSSISSPRRGGFEPLKSSDNPGSPLRLFQRFIAEEGFGLILFLAGLILFCPPAPAFTDSSPFAPSKEAAERCRSKLEKLKDFPDKRKSGEIQTTKLTQNEINSYLALDLSSQYHPCLKSLLLVFEKDRLKATATIDVDRLGTTSQKLLPRLIGLMFSGIHTLAAEGQLTAKDGKAHFVMEKALFDGNALPKPLVETIISAVGRQQKPPFDPLQPSEMPYEINKVDVKSGYIIVVQ